jgi:hypothetical protein
MNDRLPLFDGFPYLVTRVVGAFRHVLLLPADRTEAGLRRLAELQDAANHLETCLVLEPERVIYYSAGAEPSPSTFAPRGGSLVTGELCAAEDFEQAPELLSRTQRLEEYIDALDQRGYVLGDQEATFRAATPEELACLAGRDTSDVPRGLVQCATCGEYRGISLVSATAPGLVTTVYCRCENHNLCARCSEPLAEWRLNANYFNRRDRKIWHLAAFSGFSHQCAGRIQ